MLFKSCILLILLFNCECVYIYSSFWAPLFNPRIINYRVDAAFDPNGGKNAREEYFKGFGYRGERLIAELGNGKRERYLGGYKIIKDIKVHTY